MTNQAIGHRVHASTLRDFTLVAGREFAHIGSRMKCRVMPDKMLMDQPPLSKRQMASSNYQYERANFSEV